MRVLFVCRANIGRSQVAMAYYNVLHPGQAESAGTLVTEPGQKIKSRPEAKVLIPVMKAAGMDISNNVRSQVTPAMIRHFDKVVVMAEPNTVPTWLRRHPKVVFWKVPDLKGRNADATKEIMEYIRSRLYELN